MPISSGFGYYPYNYPTTKTTRAVPTTQLIARAAKFRALNLNGSNTKAKLKPTDKLPPPLSTRMNLGKRSSTRSDTFVLLAKTNEAKSRVRQVNQVRNDSRRLPAIAVPVRKTSVPREKKSLQIVHSKSVNQPIPKYVRTSNYQREPEYTPVSLVKKHNSAYYPSPVRRQQLTPPFQDDLDVSRRVRIGKHDYVVQRKIEPVDYIDDDYQSESFRQKRTPRRVVRVVRDPPHRDDDDDDDDDNDDVYYLKRSPPRRQTVIRKSTPKEYVHIEKTPPIVIRPPRPSRPEIVYIDDEQPLPYNDDYMFVDEDGHEVKFANGRIPSARNVQYAHDDKDRRRSHQPEMFYIDNKDKQHTHGSHIIYVDDKDKRRGHESEVIYVDDTEQRQSRQPEIVYIDDKDKRHGHQPKVIYIDDQDKRRVHESEVIYVDDTEQRRARQPEVVYVDDVNKRRPHQSEVIYVEDNNHRRPHQTEVVYVEDRDERRLPESEVVYVEEEPLSNKEHYTMMYTQPSSTRLVYQ